jgi:glycosyltransferase involved in cell wall biosynthesis
MKMVTWLSVLTEHQAHTFRHLGALGGKPVEYVLGARAIKERHVQGWTEMDVAGLSIHELPKQGWWSFGTKIITRFPDAVHIFNGMWGDRRFFFLLLYAQWHGVRTCLITEPYADRAVSYFSKRTGLSDRIKSAVRPWLYKVAGALVARRMTAVFAISEKAVNQFEAIGFSQVKVFPFGYFVPALAGHSNDAEAKGNAGRLRLIFVGGLIERKGLFTLVDAIELCNASGQHVSLDVYGPGDCGAIHAPDRFISCRGSIPFGKAQGVIRQYDALVVPSLHDGWAVVVNEALLQGVPVICSDAVGAGVLVQKTGAGCIFPATDDKALASLLTELLRSSETLLDWRSKAAGLSDWLSPAVAAKYQLDCLQFALGQSNIRPSVPWYP